MYAIVLSIVLLLYSFILADFSLIFKDMNASADTIAATQAFYSAESAIEKSWHLLSDLPESELNKVFLDESIKEEENQNDAFLQYNQGAESGYLQRAMTLFHADLAAADAFDESQRSVRSNVYFADSKPLDQTSIYGLEPRSSNRFAIRETEPEHHFNEITFEYNQDSEESDVVFEVFLFPKEGHELYLPHFQELKEGVEGSIKRIVINSLDPALNGRSFDGMVQNLTVTFETGKEEYGNQIRIRGFNPLALNYILSFQTLDQKPIHYKLSAFHQGRPVMLPNVMQTIDVVGTASGGIHQRIKMQKQTEFPLLPEFNFVHFSNERIDK